MLVTRCCAANYKHRAELDGKPLPKPFSLLSTKQQDKVTFFPYCDNCGNKIKLREVYVSN